MKLTIATFLGIASYLALVAAECPNACSAHGKCGSYDMCVCYRNWMANDCSERICQFGLAHVDTPKGDLDASGGKLTGPDVTVVKNDFVYPYGTQEQFPATENINGNVLLNTAHEYRECSNKGLCDRQTGTCACFEGYDGSACQRASCPSNADGVCSGHGTCETIAEIAKRDYDNYYQLWDADATMGCVCDGGYTGSDCSERMCKFGTDPLYSDDGNNVRYSNYTYQFYAQTVSANLTGNYSLIFYDSGNEDWQTEPISWDADCATIISALEHLPNNVIPTGSVRCYKDEKTLNGGSIGQHASGVEPIYDANMYVISKYTIAFSQNPGKLKQISINKYLDGSRPTLYTGERTSTLGWQIYPNGFIGENVDMVPTQCEGVLVTLGSSDASTEYTHYLTGLTSAEERLLKICLGDSNGDSSDNVEVYDWDYGDQYNPHLIKLVDATQDTNITTIDPWGDTSFLTHNYPVSKLCTSITDTLNVTRYYDADGAVVCRNPNPPGFYAVVYYDSTLTSTYPFRIYTRAAQDYGTTTQFRVFTTDGYLQLVNINAGVYTSSVHYSTAKNVENHYSNIVHLTNTTGSTASNVNYANYLGAMDCQTNAVGDNGALDCLDKDDYVMILRTTDSDSSNVPTALGLAANPVYPNIYQVKKIGVTSKVLDSDRVAPYADSLHLEMTLDYGMNSNYYLSGGFAGASDTTAQVYKFYPSTANADGGYRYAAECSTRGVCNKKTGQCSCFPGFSKDNCDVVNALAK